MDSRSLPSTRLASPPLLKEMVVQKYSDLATIAISVGLAAALLSSLSCGTSQGHDPQSAGKTYVYVAEWSMVGMPPDGGSVAQFQLASDGTLIPLNPATVITNETPVALTIDPLNRYLFAPGPLPAGSGSSDEFTIGGNGTLTASSLSGVDTGNPSMRVAFTPNGQFAIVASGSDTVSSYSVGPSGAFTPINSVPSGFFPQSVVIDPSGKFVYVANFSDSTISEYTLSANGMLHANGFVPTGGSTPQYITISPKNFLYCANGNSQTVSEFSINQTTGSLAFLRSFPTGNVPESIGFDPSGRYAYVTNEGDDSVSQFTVAATTGALAKDGADVPMSNLGPIQIVVDPSGKFAFTANANGSVSQFTIGKTGMLIPNGTVALGTVTAPVAAEGIAIGKR